MTEDVTPKDAPFAELRRLAGDAPFSGIDPESAIVMLWRLDGERVIAASRTALRFFGAYASEDLTGRRFGPALPSTARIAEIGRHLSVDDPPRAERIRFFIGNRSDLLACLCRRIAMTTGEQALLVVSPDPRHSARGTQMMPQIPLAPMATAGPAEILANEPRAREPQAQKTTPLVQPAAEETRPFDAPPAAPPSIVLQKRAPLPRRPVRFVFETDADGCVLHLSPQLGDIVGAERAALVGRTFAEAGGIIGVSGADAMMAHLGRGEGWQGLALEWPLGPTPHRVPIELSGLPLYDGERRLRGFRGFGLIRLDTLSEETLHDADRLADHAEAKSVLDTAEPASGEDRGVRPGLDRPDPEPSNIVALQSGRAQPATASPRLPTPEGANENAPAPAHSSAPASRPSPAPDESETRLSQTDRNAFREIARALGARLADDMPEPPGAKRQGARPVEAAAIAPSAPPPPTTRTSAAFSERPGETDPSDARAERAPTEADIAADAQADHAPAVDLEAGAETIIETTPGRLAPTGPSEIVDTIIDRLPIGILVLGGREALFLNRTLLDLLGCEDADAFRRSGASGAILDSMIEMDMSAIEPRSLTLLDGSALDVLAHAQAIAWRGAPATLISIRSALPRQAPADLTPPANAAPAPDGSLLESHDRLESHVVDLQQRLRSVEAEREEFRAILDTATDGVISLDAEGRITGLNRSAEALFGVDQNEVAGQRFSVLLAGESHASAIDYLDGLKSGGVASVLNDGREVIAREKKGGRIPLFMTLGRISDRDSGRFCAVLRDLTAWKKAEAELTDSKRVAERASQMKSDFLAKISHEIRTPMNAIIGFSEVMRTEQFGPIGSERYREYLGDIHRSGEHVISLVNDLLDLSKIEAGRAELAFTSVSLNDVVAECVSMMQPQATRERVIMRSNLAERMPHVVADERSIKQVVLNLLSNACKFNQPGGQVIVSTALSDTDEAVIRVRDTGIGMSEKDVEGAMQPFRQMSPTRRGGGTGLGLPLTKALIEANRASLAIRSAVSEGTLVEVTFPATRVLAE